MIIYKYVHASLYIQIIRDTFLLILDPLRLNVTFGDIVAFKT